jgi:MYXO-CTERM domain-containing protein
VSELLADRRDGSRLGALGRGLSRTPLLAWLLLLLWVANLCDLALTLGATALQRASEANPLMGALLEVSPAGAALLKVGLVALVLTLLWLLRRRREVLPLVVALDVAYVALVFYETLSLASG